MGRGEAAAYAAGLGVAAVGTYRLHVSRRMLDRAYRWYRRE